MVVSVSQSHSHAAPGSAPSPDLATLLAKVEATSHRRECAPPLRGANLTPSNSIAPRICWPLLQSAFVKPGFGTKAEWVGSQKSKKDTPAPRKLFVFFFQKGTLPPSRQLYYYPIKRKTRQKWFLAIGRENFEPPQGNGQPFWTIQFQNVSSLIKDFSIVDPHFDAWRQVPKILPQNGD